MTKKQPSADGQRWAFVIAAMAIAGLAAIYSLLLSQFLMALLAAWVIFVYPPLFWIPAGATFLLFTMSLACFPEPAQNSTFAHIAVGAVAMLASWRVSRNGRDSRDHPSYLSIGSLSIDGFDSTLDHLEDSSASGFMTTIVPEPAQLPVAAFIERLRASARFTGEQLDYLRKEIAASIPEWRSSGRSLDLPAGTRVAGYLIERIIGQGGEILSIVVF